MSQTAICIGTTSSVSSTGTSQPPSATKANHQNNDTKSSIFTDRSDEIRALEMKIAACDQDLLAYRAAAAATQGATKTRTTRHQRCCITKGQQRRRALDILRRKKHYEAQKESLMAHSANLEMVQLQLESAQATMMTVRAIAAARDELAKLHITVDDIDEMALDLQEFNEDLSHVDSVMGDRTLLCYGVPDLLDEHDLEAEFLRLEDEVWDDENGNDQNGGNLLEIPMAPQSKPTMPKRTEHHQPSNGSNGSSESNESTENKKIAYPNNIPSITNGPTTTETTDTVVKSLGTTKPREPAKIATSAMTTAKSNNNNKYRPSNPDCNTIVQARSEGPFVPSAFRPNPPNPPALANADHLAEESSSLLTTRVVPSREGEPLVPPQSSPIMNASPPGTPNRDDSFCFALDDPRNDITDDGYGMNKVETTTTITNEQSSCGSAMKSIGSPRSVAVQSISRTPADMTTKRGMSAHKSSVSSRSISSNQLPTVESIDGIPYYEDEATARSGSSAKMDQWAGPNSMASPFRPANYPPAYAPPPAAASSLSMATPKMQLHGIPESPSSLATFARGGDNNDTDQNAECRWGTASFSSSLPGMVVTSPHGEMDESESFWTDYDTVQTSTPESEGRHINNVPSHIPSAAATSFPEAASVSAMLAMDTSFGRRSAATSPVENMDTGSSIGHGDEATTGPGTSVTNPTPVSSFDEQRQPSPPSTAKMQFRGISGIRSLPAGLRGDEPDAESRWASLSLPGRVVTIPRDPPPPPPPDDMDDVASTWTDHESVQQKDKTSTTPLLERNNRAADSAASSQSHSRSSSTSIHFHYHFPAVPIGSPIPNSVRQRTSSNGNSIVVETQVWTNDADSTSLASTQSWNNNTTMDRRPDDLASVAKSVISFDSHMTPKSTAYTGEQAMTGLTTLAPSHTGRPSMTSVEKPARFSLQHFLRPVTAALNK